MDYDRDGDDQPPGIVYVAVGVAAGGGVLTGALLMLAALALAGWPSGCS